MCQVNSSGKPRLHILMANVKEITYPLAVLTDRQDAEDAKEMVEDLMRSGKSSYENIWVDSSLYLNADTMTIY